MKSGAKHSEASVSEVLCLHLQAAESWSYVFIFSLEKLLVLHKNMQTIWWLHDLRSLYRKGGLATRVFWFIFLNLPSKEEVT